MGIEAVLLDMGGVLLDMRASNGVPQGQLDYRGRQVMLRALAGGRRLSLDDLESLVFEPWRRDYRERYRRGREAALAPYLEELRARAGSRASDAELLAAWFGPFGESLQPVPGALEAVEQLRRRQLKLGLVSNVPLPGELYRGVLLSHGFGGQFDACRFSFDCGHRKPSPFMLRSALEELGVDASAAVMVGDRKASDVAAGRAAGTGTVWIETEHDKGPEPDASVAAIGELPALLERWGA